MGVYMLFVGDQVYYMRFIKEGMIMFPTCFYSGEDFNEILAAACCGRLMELIDIHYRFDNWDCFDQLTDAAYDYMVFCGDVAYSVPMLTA